MNRFKFESRKATRREIALSNLIRRIARKQGSIPTEAQEAEIRTLQQRIPNSAADGEHKTGAQDRD